MYIKTSKAGQEAPGLLHVLQVIKYNLESNQYRYRICISVPYVDPIPEWNACESSRLRINTGLNRLPDCGIRFSLTQTLASGSQATGIP